MTRKRHAKSPEYAVSDEAAAYIADALMEFALQFEATHFARIRGTVNRLINEGHTRIIDADLADYFGSIPHAELLKSVARRVSDRHLLHLIKMWLEAPVEEDDGRGGKMRTTTARYTGRGVPQGAPISPLLANLYMRRFVLGWKKRGLETRLGAKIVVYADDLVICCRGDAEEGVTIMAPPICPVQAIGKPRRDRGAATQGDGARLIEVLHCRVRRSLVPHSDAAGNRRSAHARQRRRRASTPCLTLWREGDNPPMRR